MKHDQHRCLLLLFGITALATACPQASDRVNVSRAREDALKRGFPIDFATTTKHVFHVLRESSYSSSDVAPSLPTVAVPRADGVILILENNSGRVFVDSRAIVSELQLQDRLVFPGMLRPGLSEFHVSDNDGLKTFDYLGRRQTLLRLFLAIHDFVLTPAQDVVINPIMRKTDAPILVVVRPPSGSIRTSWGEALHLGTSQFRTAHLTSCADHVVAGLAHVPSVFVFSSDLGSHVAVDVPFPNKAGLMSLSEDEALARPAPGVVTYPTFISGLACAGDSFFVLLDLPRLFILEYEMSGMLVGAYYSESERPNRHYRGLGVHEISAGTMFVTIAVDGGRVRSVVEAVATKTNPAG